MKQKKVLVVILTACIVLSMSTAFASSNSYNGWSQAAEVWLQMKWSKDWTNVYPNSIMPLSNQPVGAWVTWHLTWYSNNYHESEYYGFYSNNLFGEGAYRIEEFGKVMSVGDDREGWEEFQAAGGKDIWWPYSDGVPRFVILTNTITVYDNATGTVIKTFPLVKSANPGLGQPPF